MIEFLLGSLRVGVPAVLGLVAFVAAADNSRFIYDAFIAFPAAMAAVSVFVLGWIMYEVSVNFAKFTWTMFIMTMDSLSVVVTNGLVVLTILLNSRKESAFYIGKNWEHSQPVLLYTFGILFAVDFLVASAFFIARIGNVLSGK
jgi:hypothetical protein